MRRQMHGQPVGVPRRRRGASPSACRGALDDGRRDGMGGGGQRRAGVRTRAGRGSAARGQAAGQRAGACSGAASGSGALSARGRRGSARKRERREEKGVEREKRKSNV